MAPGQHDNLTTTSNEPSFMPNAVRVKTQATPESAQTIYEYTHLLADNSIAQSAASKESYLSTISDESHGKENWEEGQRVVIHPTTKHAIWPIIKAVGFHLPPVITSFTFLYLNVTQSYYLSVDEVAKNPWKISIFFYISLAYVLCVRTSIKDLGIRLVRRCAVESSLPLGLLVGAYDDPSLGYFVSSPFLSTFWSPSNLKKDWFLKLTLFGEAIIYALVIPSLYRLVVPGRAVYSLPPGLMYRVDVNETWPTVVSAAGLSQMGQYASNRLKWCNENAVSEFSWCPVNGYRFLPDVFEDHWKTAPEFSLEIPIADNAIPSPTRKLSMYMTKVAFSSNAPAGTWTTVSSAKLPMALTLFLRQHNPAIRFKELGTKYEVKSTNHSAIFQPLVQSSCSSRGRYELVTNSSQAIFPTKGLKCFGDHECQAMLNQTIRVPDEVLTFSRDFPERKVFYNYQASDTSNGKPRPLLISAVVPLPDNLKFSPIQEYNAAVITCSVIAHWIPVSISFVNEPNGNPGGSNSVEVAVSNLTSHLKEFAWNTTGTVGPMIKIDNDWLPYLFANITPHPDGTKEIGSPVQTLIEPFLALAPLRIRNQHYGHYQIYISQGFERVLGSMVAEALARVTLYSPPEKVWIAGNQTQLARIQKESPDIQYTGQLVHFEVRGEYYGWGKFDDRLNFWFCIGIVVFHLSVAVSYFIFGIFIPLVLHKFRVKLPGNVRRVRIIEAWQEVSDLVLLAWNSPPMLTRQGHPQDASSILHGTAYIWEYLFFWSWRNLKNSPFSRRVCIRTQPGTNRAVLVADDDDEGKKLQEGVKYY